ncbi:MAG: hypothetical protein ACJ74W_21375 [Pyrinomonadaceae bacterium]
MTGIKRLTLIVALWAIATATGQQRAVAQTKQTRPPARAATPRTSPTRPAELEALIVDARSAPAEFAADVLLRLVESHKIAERAWQRALLEEAFRTAGGAQQPLKRRIVPGLNYAYTREDYQARAFQLNLNTLSLRLRAVNALLKIDKSKARALFSEIPRKLPLAPRTCDDALIYDLLDYYTTLNQIIATTFSPEEKARDEDVLFTQSYVEEMSAPEQVFYTAALVTRAGDSPARLAPLVHAYSSALRKIEADARSFTADSMNYGMTLTILLDFCQRHEISPDELLEAFRTFFVKHMGASRCAESAKTPDRWLNNFNRQLNELALNQPSLAPIKPEEITPAKIEGAAHLTPFFSTPIARSLFRTAQELRFGLADEPEPDEDRVDPKRGEKLLVWLNAMADWRAGGETSEADYFDQKCVLYQLLLEAGPNEGPAGTTLLAEYVAFLRQPARQQESRAGWLLHVQRLLSSTRFGAGDARARLRAALASSGEPVLRLYAGIQRARPQMGTHLP